MNQLLDMRFVIGLFFFIVGALLIIYGIGFVTSDEYKRNVNLYIGLFFVLFGSFMIFISKKKG